MTITEIARMAEVSVSAVSRYMNNGYVSEEKAERIREVIRKTGYRPSKQAQSMRTGRSKVIGVILPRLSSESIARVADGISEVLAEEGYQMLLASTENDPKKEIEYLRLLDKNPVDGILFSATIFDKEHREALNHLHVPIVIIGQKFENFPCVYHDDYGAEYAMMEQLLKSGRKRIGYLCVNQKDEAAGRQRTKAYCDALKAYGHPLRRELVEETGFSVDSGYEAMKRLADRAPELDAVCCATDSLAVGAMMYLKEAGRQIPKEIAVTGVGHNRMSNVVTPKLTTAHLHYRTSGGEAARILVESIEKKDSISRQLMLGYDVILSESI